MYIRYARPPSYRINQGLKIVLRVEPLAGDRVSVRGQLPEAIPTPKRALADAENLGRLADCRVPVELGHFSPSTAIRIKQYFARQACFRQVADWFA